MKFFQTHIFYVFWGIETESIEKIVALVSLFFYIDKIERCGDSIFC